MEIVFDIIWMLILFADIWVQHKTLKSNKETNQNIDALAKLFNQSINQTNDYMNKTDACFDASDKKTTAQANFLWQSIMILANRISDLEDDQHV